MLYLVSYEYTVLFPIPNYVAYRNLRNR